MAKILRIRENVVSIGTDDGKIKEVRLADLNFTPEIGTEVDIFETEDDIIVSEKVNTKKEENNMNSGININVSNNQGVGYPQQVSYNNTKAVNKTIYCLLCLFLGGLGVHKFYAGKIGSGIVYILFCWTYIPSIIAFIELIIALCRKADVNGNILV